MNETRPTPDSLLEELAYLRSRLALLERTEAKHRQAEDSLRESERRLATLLSNLPGMAYRCRNEPDWPMEFVSDGCIELLGHEPHELIDGTVVFAQFILAEERDTVWNQVQLALDENRPFQLVYRIKTSQGKEKWVWEQGRGVYSPDGALLALEGFITDITERKRAGQALRFSEERFRTVVEKSLDVIALVDEQANFLYVTPAITQVLGFNVEEYVGTNGLEYVHAEDQEEAKRLLEAAMAAPGSTVHGEVRHRHRDGSWRTVEGILVNRLGDPNVAAIVCTYRDITDRRRSEQAVRDSERHFRLLFERNLAGVFRATLDGRLLDCNDSFAHILGYPSRQEVLAEPDREVYYDSAEREMILANLRRQPVLTNFEMRIRRQDGRLVWALANASVMEGDDGKSIIEGTLFDITIRKRMERELAHERDLFNSLMDNTPLCIYFKDPDSRFTRMNRASMANLGIQDAGQGTSDFDYFPEELALKYYSEEQQIIETGKPLIGNLERQPRSDGSVRWFLSTKMPVFGREGQVTGIVGISTDISERKRAEEALQESLTLLQAVTEGTMDAVFVKDRDGKYVMINSAGADLIGMPVNQVIGRTDAELFLPETARLLAADDQEVLEGGQRRTIERTYELNGVQRTFLITQSPQRDHEGNIIGIIGVSHDITERKQLEEQLRHSQKMEAVGQLAGGVAHDFNNLLTAILGNTILLIDSIEDDNPKRELLEQTEKAALRAADLTSQLLGFSRQTLLRLEPLDLNKVMHETVGILRHTIDPRIRVEVEARPDLWTVQADPGQMTQVLMNLCLNARDAMPQGGLLRLETTHAELDESAARQHLDARAGEFVRLRVKDTGHGISPEIQSRIFDPFFTTKEQGMGTGLGLAMVFGIVRQHQGWIEFRTEAGQGTCFDICLPRLREGMTELPATPAPMEPQGGQETILLVDDEAIIRSLGRTILQRYGYRILLAEDGQEALEIYQNSKDNIDLVILDLVMPRLPGKDTMRKMQQVDPKVRVLFSSGYSSDQVTEAESEAVVGFVHKPYRPQELAQKVRMALDQIQGKVM